MSWLNIAAELVRGAMNARQTRPPKPSGDVPKDIEELMDAIHQYRSEVNSGIEALAQTIQDQRERQLRAMRAQRRWNYGLLLGLVAMAVTGLVLYLR
jgi:hypothetical protein